MRTAPRNAADIARAAATFVSWLVLPQAISIAFHLIGLGAVTLAVLLPWKFLVFPHDWAVVREFARSRPVWSDSTAVLIAVFQWACACAAYSWFAARLRWRTHLWLAPLVIVGIGIGFLLISGVVGVQIEGDWV